jgi:hypothetical protein
MDKTCLEIQDLIALGSETQANERIAIESHVSICPDCERELAETHALLNNLALLRDGEMPAGASERIWAGVRSVVPGRRRLAFMTWSSRAAAILVFGLTVGYTAKSIAGLKAGPAHRGISIEEPIPDETRATLVPRHLFSRGATTDAGPQDGKPVPQLQMPESWTLHYLPNVDEILEPGVVRF